jgi:putative spermidine/putrescine transport system permease protein
MGGSHRSGLAARGAGTAMKFAPTPALLIAPAVLLLGGLFGAAFGFSVAQSLGLWSVGVADAPTTRYYRALWSTPDMVRSLGLTLYVSTATTRCATAGGLLLALVLLRVRRWAAVVRVLIQLPLPVPHMAAAVGVALLLTQSGLLARLGHALGLLAAPADMPPLIYDRYAIGIIAAYTWKEAPFVALALAAALSNRAREAEHMARTLGASPWQTFWRITFPTVAPTLLGVATVVWVFTFGAFEVPLLLGQSYPRMLAVEAYTAYNDTNLLVRPIALALNSVIVVVTALATVPYLWLLRRANREHGDDAAEGRA